MTNEEKPAATLPPPPWRASEFRASREEPVIEITDGDGKPIAWIPQRWDEMTEGNRGYDFPQSEALASLLLRAPQVEAAARELSDHLWRVLEQGERSLYGDDTHELMVALREALGEQR